MQRNRLCWNGTGMISVLKKREHHCTFHFLRQRFAASMCSLAHEEPFPRIALMACSQHYRAERDPIFNPNPHSMDEFWYSLFDHGNMWRQRSGSIICTGQPYGNWKKITDSFRNMKEKFGYPDSIKMCPLGDRYRFRPNVDFMLLFYCNRAKGLYLPEIVTNLYSGMF